MKGTVVEKILKEHIFEGELIPSTPIAIKIDQTLTQDATGTMAFLQFEALGISNVQTELSVSYIDHNTLQMGFENADDHRYLESVADRFGVVFSRAGNGICHQVHLERFGAPGKTLLGSDSHTPTGGGIGMFAIGAGGLDVACAMSGEPFYLTCPKVIGVHLTGKLPDWVSAKDVILKVLSILTSKGNVGCALEYFGEGVKNLTVPDRATITNMGAETGVTTSVFPSDEETRRFLRAEGRENVYRELSADKNAEYERVIEIDMSKLEPLVAKPHNPDNVVSIKEVEGTEVAQVCIGSCTNSSYRDLMVVAMVLKDRKIAPNISLVITPGSRQVLQMITKESALMDMINAGVRIMEPTCGFCIGMGQAPPSGAVSVRTINRNFEGRTGTQDAQVYLTSPEVAVATAIKGAITDPREIEMNYPKIDYPDRFIIDDSMFSMPKNPNREIVRGPNIGPPPKNIPLPEEFRAVINLKVGDKITTDHIMPAGGLLKYRSNIDKYARYVFYNVDDKFADRCDEYKSKGYYCSILAGESYGQGSSREHAAMCPMHLGVKAVLAISIERIHRANLVNFGIMPLYITKDDYNQLNQNDTLYFSEPRKNLEKGENIKIINETQGYEFTCSYDLSDRETEIILAGGLLNFISKKHGG
ncbi:MAG: aconitate hydratase [bacterium]